MVSLRRLLVAAGRGSTARDACIARDARGFAIIARVLLLDKRRDGGDVKRMNILRAHDVDHRRDRSLHADKVVWGTDLDLHQVVNCILAR